MGRHQRLALFALAVLLLALTPGPVWIYLISRTLTQGRRAGYFSLIGVMAGVLVQEQIIDSDWIELRNTNATSVNLAGWHLTDELGLPLQQVEATAFAWLGYCFSRRQGANLPAVTGASGRRVLQIEGQALALLKRGDEVMVMPIDQATARRLTRIAVGDAVSINTKGSIKTSQGRSR